jgi:Zn-dependent membrane protease YugP
MGYGFDWTWMLLIPAILLSLWAQFKVKSTFNKYSKVPARSGMAGLVLAKRMLEDSGLGQVAVEETPGTLTDHYDPRTKVLRLSSSVARSSSVAALGVAAHEVGHAIQHQQAYQPFMFRIQFVPAAQLGSTLSFPFILLGLFFSFNLLINIGILFFSAAVLFQLITLPVELNASHRALAVLNNRGYLIEQENGHARKVLNAAALTYIAAAAVAVLQLMRLLFLRNSRD